MKTLFHRSSDSKNEHDRKPSDFGQIECCTSMTFSTIEPKNCEYIVDRSPLRIVLINYFKDIYYHILYNRAC